MVNNAYDFEFTKIDGKNKIKLKDFEGKLILVINTASLCRFTKQHGEIETLWQRYKDKGLMIIGVPSNNFGKQEPSHNEEIAEFYAVNFNTSFTLTEKTEVVSEKSHPFFVWIREKLGWLAGPKWNFYKFLIDTHGQPIAWFSPLTSSMHKKTLNIIDKNLPPQNSYEL